MIDGNLFDVIVIGAGPAGSTTATLLAQKGHSVLLLERDTFPRFKIGESLMPGTYWTLQKLGVLDRMKASHFPRKFSVQFFHKSGKPAAPFYFFENDPHESSGTWQVLRSEFDLMLFQNAIEKGVQGYQEVSVTDVLLNGDQANGVTVRFKDGETRDIHSKVVVDASGQNALLSRKMDIKRPEPALRKAAIFAHFEGALRDDGIDEGATLILHTANQDSWFWYIPMPHNRVSVGVVGDIDYLLRNRDADAEKIFQEELELCPEMKRRIEPACQVFPAKTVKEFSYGSPRIAGGGWVLVGDAFGFLDPIYSSGVLLALKSGEMAAESIHEGLRSGDLSGARLGKFGPEFLAGMEAVRKLVYAFYTKDFSFAEFLKKFPDRRQQVIDILVGDVFRKKPDGLFGPLSEMCELPEDRKLDI